MKLSSLLFLLSGLSGLSLAAAVPASGNSAELDAGMGDGFESVNKKCFSTCVGNCWVSGFAG